MALRDFPSILSDYTQLLDVNLSSLFRDSSFLALPKPSIHQVMDILTSVKNIFEKEPSLLKLESDIIIVGDLHGNLIDLIRIFQKFGLPPQKHYLFLGDLVDRGPFSLEVCLFVLILKLVFPLRVHLIRGNHEFEMLCSPHGLALDIATVYDNNQTLLQYFIKAFAYIPLGAVIDGKILAIHGGLGPDLHSLNQIAAIHRPIYDFELDILKSLLWSDPKEGAQGYPKSENYFGFFFGEADVDRFLTVTGLQMIIRGHEVVECGYKEVFNGKVGTVFSSSNYYLTNRNQGAVLELLTCENKVPHFFTPLPYIDRSRSMLLKSSLPDIKAASSSKLLSIERPVIRRVLNDSKLRRGRPAKKVLASQSVYSIKNDASFVKLPYLKRE